MGNTLRFAWELLTAPSKALERIQKPDAALYESILLFIAFFLISVAFYTWKPEDFPQLSPDSPLAPFVTQRHGVLFWTQVQLWQPVLVALMAVSLAAFAGLFRSSFGSLPMKMLLAFFATAVPIVSLLYFKVLPNWIYVCLWIAIFALFAPLLRRRSAAEWKKLFVFSIVIDIPAVVLIPAVGISVVLQWEWAYNGLHYLAFLWQIVLGTYLLKRLENISTPRSLMTFIFSACWQICLVSTLFLIDLLSKDVLKALMSL